MSLTLAQRVTQRHLNKRCASLAVPHVRETPGYCGPSSLRAVLLYYGQDVSEKNLATMMALDVDGVTSSAIVSTAQKLRYEAFLHNNSTFEDVQKWLDAKVPLIVDWFSDDDGHYSVLIGLDEHYVHLMDPQEDAECIAIPREKFENLWFDFDETSQHKGLYQKQLIVVYPKTWPIPTT